jgi:predicted nucleotidyltransferase
MLGSFRFPILSVDVGWAFALSPMKRKFKFTCSVERLNTKVVDSTRLRHWFFFGTRTPEEFFYYVSIKLTGRAKDKDEVFIMNQASEDDCITAE